MKKMRRNLVLAAGAGLAMSAAAHAQFQIVNTEPGTFVDISATGTSVGTVTDDSIHTFTSTVGNALFPAGTVSVSSNGFMCAGTSTAGHYANLGIPVSGMGTTGFTAGTQGYLLPFWDDLYPVAATAATTIYWQEIGGVLIVQWHNQGHITAVAGQTIEFEVKVFGTPTGGVFAQFLYQDTVFGGSHAIYDNGLSATVGIMNDANTSFANIEYSLNAANIHDGDVLSVKELSTATGSCCKPDGTCAEITQFACTALGGVYNGDNTPCATANCPAAGACCIPSTLTCSFVTSAACTAAQGNWAGAGVTCATANCPTPGACCAPDGTCSQTTAAACATANGVYHGDNSSCSTPNICPNGSCCLGDGTCLVIGAAGCTVRNGVYGGDGTTCATANCLCTVLTNGGWEAGNFSSWTQGGNIAFTAIDTGNFVAGVVPHGGIYEAHFGPITTPGTVSQTITANVGDMITVDFWYTCQGAAGSLNSFSADLDTTNLVAFTNDNSHLTWTNFSFTVPAPVANPVLTFTCRNDPSYIFLDDIRVCVAAPVSCYANCDGSTTQPCLNVLDFGCFLNKFAANDSYANCDNSTTPPVLNVLDFGCFLNRFAAGCSGC